MHARTENSEDNVGLALDMDSIDESLADQAFEGISSDKSSLGHNIVRVSGDMPEPVEPPLEVDLNPSGASTYEDIETGAAEVESTEGILATILSVT